MQLPEPLLNPSLKNKESTEKTSYILSKKSFSYILGKWNSYLSGNETFKPKILKF